MASTLSTTLSTCLIAASLVSLGATAQNNNATSAATQSDTSVLQMQSKLVVVRAVVADKRAWRHGPKKAGDQCAFAAQRTLLRLSATEPYLPPDCDGVFVRGLAARDFHLLVDGKEQKIESVTNVSETLRVRDNLGMHYEYSQTPAGIWSTMDQSMSRLARESADLGPLALNRYELSFVPYGSDSTGCHKIKVKADRRSTFVAARDEYCASEAPFDVLSGSPFGDRLEQNIGSGQPGEIPLELQAAAFKIDNGGRIQISLQFPLNSLYRQWSKDWTLHASIGVLGEVYRSDGTLASRFSDFACCTQYSVGAVLGAGLMTMDNLNQLTEQLGLGPNIASKLVVGIEEATLPTRYETHLDLPPGEYDLLVVLSDGKKFGRARAHLKVESYDGNGLALSPVMLSHRFQDAHVAEVETKFANFAPQYVPLVSKSVRVSPAGDTMFSRSDNLIAYFEIHDPQLATGASPGIRAHVRIVDAKCGCVAKVFPAFDVTSYEKVSRAIVPIARSIPLDKLSKGEYRLEVQASDASGRTTPWQAASFSISRMAYNSTTPPGD